MALDDALTADEVAALLRVSRNTVYNLVKRDELASYHVGRKMRFTRADVENYIVRAGAANDGAVGAVPDGGVEPPRVRLEPDPAGRPALRNEDVDSPAFVIAGNDMIGDLFANYLGSLGIRVERRYQDSFAALQALYRGEADAALTHLFDGADESYNVGYVRHLVPGTALKLARLAARQQGFIVRRGNPKGVFNWNDLARPDVRLVNRELGSGTRVLLDEELLRAGIDGPRDVAGYDDVAATALVAAAAVERGSADVGVGAERVARQVEGVDFVPLREERLDVALSLAPRARQASEAVLRLTRTRTFRAEVAAITGYDVREMGRVVLDRGPRA